MQISGESVRVRQQEIVYENKMNYKKQCIPEAITTVSVFITKRYQFLRQLQVYDLTTLM